MSTLKGWKLSLTVAFLIVAPLSFSVPAFASMIPAPDVFPLNLPTSGAVPIPKGQTSVDVSITNFDSALVPPTQMMFDFIIPGDASVYNVKTEFGTLVSGTTYTVPVPNFGKTETVYIESSYTGNNGGLGITIDGPLIDTLPEASVAAVLPLGMVIVWYLSRRRRTVKSGLS